MIIDVHAHIGHWEGSNLTPEYVIRLMRDREVHLALISSLDGGGKDTDQTEANERTLQAVLAYPHKLRGLVWVNPWLADRALNNATECLNLERKFVGLKFHPHLNNFCFDNPHIRPFLRLAKEYGIPVAVHTAYDNYSLPDRVATAAANKDFSDVKFILYHAGLDPPNAEIGTQTLQLVASQPNLYVDISWLDLDRLRQTLEIVPMERILFGTDLPLGGDKHYWDYFEKLKALNLSNDQWIMLMEANPREVFRL